MRGKYAKLWYLILLYILNLHLFYLSDFYIHNEELTYIVIKGNGLFKINNCVLTLRPSVIMLLLLLLVLAIYQDCLVFVDRCMG